MRLQMSQSRMVEVLIRPWAGTCADPPATRGEILGERELEALRAHLAQTPDRFESFCDALMDSYRQTRSPQAFSLLFQLNVPRFTRRVRSMLGRRASAAVVDDVLSDVFLAIWMYPDRFDVHREAAFRCWSHTIIRHKVYRALRPQRTESMEIDQLEEKAAAGTTDDPGQLAAAREQLAVLNEQIVFLLLMVESAYRTSISERERLAVRLVDLEGYDSEEAARILGVKVGNLRMILCRGRRKIKAVLAPTRKASSNGKTQARVDRQSDAREPAARRAA